MSLSGDWGGPLITGFVQQSRQTLYLKYSVRRKYDTNIAQGSTKELPSRVAKVRAMSKQKIFVHKPKERPDHNRT